MLYRTHVILYTSIVILLVDGSNTVIMDSTEIHVSNHLLTITERTNFLSLVHIPREGEEEDEEETKFYRNFQRKLSLSRRISESNKSRNEDCKIPLNLETERVDSPNVKIGHTPPSDTGQVENPGWRKFTGFALTFVHVLAFSSIALLVKLLDYHPFSLAVWRFQGIFIPSLIILISSVLVQRSSNKETAKDDHKPSLLGSIWPVQNNWKTISLLILRGFMGSCAIFMFFFSLKYIDIADSLVIQAAAPIFINLLAYFVLKESCGIFPVILAALTLVGVGIISRPPVLTGADHFDDNTLIGCGFALGSMFASVVSFVLVRYLKGVHYSILTFTFGLWGTGQSLIAALIIGVFHFPIGLQDIVLTVSLAVGTFIAQITLTLALKREEAGPVAIFRTLNCVVGFILQKIFLNVSFDFYSMLGASIVLIGVVSNVGRKYLSLLPEDSKVRKALFFVLK